MNGTPKLDGWRLESAVGGSSVRQPRSLIGLIVLQPPPKGQATIVNHLDGLLSDEPIAYARGVSSGRRER
jgi:hypothetical protein